MVKIQEVLRYRGSLVDAVDENGDVVPVGVSDEYLIDDKKLTDDERELKKYTSFGWVQRAEKCKRKIDAKRGADIGRRALEEIQSRKNK